MKKLILFPFLLMVALISQGQKGYEIKVTLKPFTNQYVYLGYYSGKQYPVVDSVKLDNKSQGIFKGSEPLGGGIYLLAYPSKKQFQEFIVDKQQHFSIIADTAKPFDRKFVNSPENLQFLAYQNNMNGKSKSIHEAREGLRTAASANDSARWSAKLKILADSLSTYRRQVIRQNPNSFLSVLMSLMEEPKVPSNATVNGKYDSSFAYRYFKNHYWEGINFWDDRVTRTPATLFDERLDKYFNTLVFPSADSVIKEIDWMLGYASISKEMTRYLLVKFVTRYLNMKFMWEDAVFLHLYTKYFSQKEYDWLTAAGKKTITERAYNLMNNITGNPAEDIALPDQKGNIQILYADTSKFTIVCFWDPTCGHCKETLPQLDSLYRTKWKSYGVKMYAVAKETDGTKKDWLDFIAQHKLEDWTHVYYSRAEDKMRTDANIPGYSQLYDAQTVPAVYLLDREKRIIAKKLTWQQTDEILEIKIKNQPTQSSISNN